MNGTVHTIMGLSTGMCGTVFLSDKIPILQESPIAPAAFMIAITFGSTAPDLDLPGRPLGFLGHRRLTHTLLFPAIGLLLMHLMRNSAFTALAGTVRAALFGFIWGYVMHIIADLFQRRGVPLFWPILQHNVHIFSMPVKYDRIFLFFYIIAIVVVSYLLGGAGQLKNIMTSSPAIAIAIVIGMYEIKACAKKGKR